MIVQEIILHVIETIGPQINSNQYIEFVVVCRLQSLSVTTCLYTEPGMISSTETMEKVL